MLKFRYALTTRGVERCLRDAFYLQENPAYKGYTEKIFRLLHKSEKPLTIYEISSRTGIKTRYGNGILTYNIYAGYIKRIPL